ncbi:MAG: hypothetical protein LC114_09220 [Bryobacterales bacterium]|nr:hypothetical protein [Bryobacterales bacterium]
MKTLFWTTLNYDRSNQRITRRGWPESSASVLAEDPTLLATAGAGGDFQVLYCRLAKSRLSLADERIITSRLLKNHPYSLFLFSDETQQKWHFVNVKDGDDTERRRHYRRLTIGPAERMRTASEVISKLDVGTVSKASGNSTGFVIQEQHDTAFDIGPVQKDFFRIFADVYHRVAEDIAREKGFEEEAGRLAQLLLDRLLFLYFVQKKGWLNQEPDYLYSRFKQCWRKEPKGDSFYAEVLAPLFQCLSEQDKPISSVGSVPFLNGGLFEESESQNWTERVRQSRLHVRNSTFKIVFDDLLERFNFTVTEDTPLDIEVAIDVSVL